MFSILHQEKTTMRNSRGASVYRRFYLCDTSADVSDLPTDDAPGSAVLVADGGTGYILDHACAWRIVGPSVWATLRQAGGAL